MCWGRYFELLFDQFLQKLQLISMNPITIVIADVSFQPIAAPEFRPSHDL
jgi:hypothetical protein